MAIGLGGGAASSMQTGANLADLDFDSVQRGNAEIQRRAQEVIDRCWGLGDANPILSIHDVGAGGLSNALPELVHGAERGGNFDLRAVPSEERGMSPLQIWCNESQERYVLAIAADRIDEFRAIWKALLPLTRKAPPVWVLRDFHSPNLLWLPARSGIARVGLIDTQDCVMGDPAYDLVSLLQDARVDVDEGTMRELFDLYCQLRADDRGFDRASFAASFAVLGAQRATKILGIFSRLSMRDGKHGYLAHIPRVSRYLEMNLEHGALAPLRAWFDRHLPRAKRDAHR